MSCNPCEQELDPHEVVACEDDYLKGGISAGAYLLCGHTIEDFTNTQQWTDNLSSGKVVRFTKVLGNVPAASPVLGPSPVGCGPREVLDTFDRTFIFQDYNVSANNNDHYNSVNNRSYDGIVWFHCEDNQISVVDDTRVDVQALDITPEDNAVKRQYQVTAKWRKRAMPDLFAAPAGIFD